MDDILQTRPLPSLKETLENYLKNLQPLVAEKDFDHSSKLCAQFLSGPGPELHEKLLEIDANPEQANWSAGFWDSMYLKQRDPLPIHSSPFFAVRDQALLQDLPLAEMASRLVYATNAVISAIRDGSFSPEYSRGVAQDMVQYERFFGYARNPALHRDEKRFDPAANTICVLHRNRIFTLDVFHQDGCLVSVKALSKSIADIIEHAEKAEETHQFVGYFTADERDHWARKKDEIRSLSPGNREALEKIDASLYVLCLDEEPIADLNDIAEKLLHNEGRNRFFDKYQIVIFGDGNIGSIFEHAPVDALSVGRIWNETIWHLENPAPHNNAGEHNQHGSAGVSELLLELNPAIEEDIERSRQRFQMLAGHTQPQKHCDTCRDC
jgi:carnitine O-acetyltransferase